MKNLYPDLSKYEISVNGGPKKPLNDFSIAEVFTGHAPKECYEDFGRDLDGCSGQQLEGCSRCRCFIKE